MNKILSEQLKRSKQLMGIREDVEVSLPSLKVTKDGLLSIDGKRYKLKKGFIKITVHDVIVDKNEEVTLVASTALTAKQSNKILKSQVDKIVKGVKAGKSPIYVHDLEGTEFKLVRA